LAIAINLLLALTLGTLLVSHRQPVVVERIVYVATPPASGAFASDGDLGRYLKLRHEILKHGLDALPETASGSSDDHDLTPESGRRALLEKLLRG
jgi:hypothetical protein